MTTATIPSRTGSATYTVRLHDDGTTACTCIAGSFGKPCWHTKALVLAATEELARREAAAADEAFRQYCIAGLRRLIAVTNDKLAIHPENSSRYAGVIAKAERDLAALAEVA